MKRLLAVVVLSLLIVQLCLLPMAVTAFVCPSVVTLPATNITSNAATLNGSVTIPLISGSMLMPNAVLLVSSELGPIDVIRVFVSFQYGTAPGTYTAVTPLIPISQSGTFQASVSGLAPCTTYYACAKLQTLVPTMFNQFGLKGAGVGLDYNNLQQLFSIDGCDSYVTEISFQTLGCQIGTGAGGSSFSGITTTTQPVSLPNLITQSANLSAKAVTPGTPVTVTANIINKSAVNGNKKVTLYVNGQVETTQGVTVNSGGSSQLTFSVSRSEPGDYNVYVDGVPAGSFKVELVTGPDAILMFSVALVALAFLIGMVMLWRRQSAV